MPKKGNNNQKSFKPMEEIEESESKLMVIRPKREASKNVSKIVASIVNDEDIISSSSPSLQRPQPQKINSAFTNISPLSFINPAYSTKVNKLLSAIPSKEEFILNKQNIGKIINEKSKRARIAFDMNDDMARYLNHSLNNYMKTLIEKLISINRTRNVNFNLFSRNTVTGVSIPSYKINTYNLESSGFGSKVSFVPSNQFQILFTRNIKNDFNTIEEYHELNSKRINLEKVVLYKNKLEEIAKEKGNDAGIKITSGPNPIKLGPGRRTRKKDSAIIKTMRNNFVKSQKKEDYDRQKSFTMNTLDTFLDNSTRYGGTKSLGGTVSNMRFDAESSKNDTHLETFTKISEASKSEYNHNNFVVNDNTNNEVSINVFKSNNIEKSGKIYGTSRRKISLKDFIFFLENEMNVPLKMLLLQKAEIRISKLNHNNH